MEEAKQALETGETLKAAGCDLMTVVETAVLLAAVDDFSPISEIHSSRVVVLFGLLTRLLLCPEVAWCLAQSGCSARVYPVVFKRLGASIHTPPPCLRPRRTNG